MDYTFNPLAMSSMFSVPCDVVDKYLKLAGQKQLQVLLWVFRNPSVEQPAPVCAAFLGIPESEVKDALDFWCGCSILKRNGLPEPAQAVSAPKKKERTALAASKPSREDAIRRASESEEIKFMFQDVQLKLGRLVSQNEMATLVWLHDNQGLPVSVILLSVQYAVSEGRTNFSYIEKMCLDWAANDVDTLEKAEERLNQLYLTKTAWRIAESAFGIKHRKPSANEEKYAARWINEWGFTKEMLTLAYDRCIDAIHELKFPYINKILTDWHKKGIKTAAELETEPEQPKSSKKRDTSYNLDKIKAGFSWIDKED